MSKQSSYFYLHAKKSLGQNFLNDPSVIEDIVQSANDFLLDKNVKNANVLEIGPGTGALTKALLNSKNVEFKIDAVEKDHRAIKGLNENLVPKYPNQLTIHDTDILKYTPTQFDLCIGNIPYYITSDILMWLCDHKNKFLGSIFMVQDEVADRLCADINTKEYSRLTIKMQLNFEIIKLFTVSKECFVPIPKVNSAIVLLIPKVFSFDSPQKEKDFESFTTLLFSQRRKMLRRIFSDSLKSISSQSQNTFWTELKKLNIEQTDRPESIDPQNMLLMFKFYRTYFSSVPGNLLP